jgi:hypothetical protein
MEGLFAALMILFRKQPKEKALLPPGRGLRAFLFPFLRSASWRRIENKKALMLRIKAFSL